MSKTAVLIALLATAGCYKIDIQQGNYIEQEAVNQLNVGMSRGEVARLLGTPLIEDPFHQQRWDYVYNFFPRGDETDGERRRLTLFFDGELLERIEGDRQATVAADSE